MIVKRHHWFVRLTHWVNVIALGIMIGSGLQIFNAYPAFARRGESFCCYPFAGKAIPHFATFGAWLAGARNWHFAMMWLFLVNGLAYTFSSICTANGVISRPAAGTSATPSRW